jgi:glycosyltransferase involved in cell wall biosynthesis
VPADRLAHRPGPDRSGSHHVGYLLKQYPRLSETFILNEIVGLEERGIEVSVFSLRHATEGRFHPDVARVRANVHYPADLDKRAFLDALRTLPDLDAARLPDALAFLDRLPDDRRPRLLLQAIDVAGRARASGVEHLHAHFLTVAAQTAHLVHLLTGIPYSVTAHAKDVYRHTVDWDVAGRVAGSAAAVVTVCDANLRYLAHRLDGTDARLVRIYNGLGPQDPPTPDVTRAPGSILGVGRLVEKKGFDVLIEAVAILAPDRPELHCVLVGDGDQRQALAALAGRLGVADRVTFAGPLPQDRVQAWMRRAQVLAAPCRVGTDGNQDALPTVLIEALGAGLPIVSTPVAGIPEIVADGVEGLLVEPDDPTALAAAIGRLQDRPELRAALGAAGPPKRERRFDRERTIGELIDAFAARPVDADTGARP